MLYNQDLLFAPAASPGELATWDSRAESDYNIPAVMLMENAARAAFGVFAQEHGITPGLEVLVLCGGGNNGGDGLALARRLLNAGCKVSVRTLKGRESYSGIALAHYDMAVAAGVDIAALPADFPANPQLHLPESPAVVVDALLGVGFKGLLRPDLLALIRYIYTRTHSYVFSLDIPSGLNAMNGRPEPEAVRANLTATFAALKPGLCLPLAAFYTGVLRVCEIGIPLALMRKYPPQRRLILPQEGVVPKTDHYAHKGQKGRVLVIGGSAGFNGAPILSALGAARSGVGLITIAAPAPLCAGLSIEHPELMTLPLAAPDWPGVISGAELDRLLEHISAMPEHSALVLGPGLGSDKITIKLVKSILGLAHRPPLVLDADGLRHCRAIDPALVSSLLQPQDMEGYVPLSLLRPGDVITPHPGEMLRLLSGHAAVSPSLNLATNQPFTAATLQIQEEREAAVHLVTQHTAAAVLLKGPGTLIAQKDTPLTIASFAESNLAVGGSGDVLSGIIAALMARDPNFTAAQAASLGAYLHGRAGIICARKFPAGGNLPTDIAEAVPFALLELVLVE